MLSAVAREKILRGFSFSCCLKSIGQLDAAARRLEASLDARPFQCMEGAMTATRATEAVTKAAHWGPSMRT
jgi:hypothetical protein